MHDFTPEQLDAIHYRKQDACVVAGPGSGKTTVLVERYRRLIVDLNFKFSEVLAITFTEKAAANMKEKIAKTFSDNPVRLREFDQAWIYTIHGFCARLLRENAIAAGIDPRFAVLDARESDELRIECTWAALDELTLKRRDETLALIEALQAPRIAPDLMSAYDAIRSAGLTTAQVRAMPSPLGSAPTAADIARRIRANVEAWPFSLTPAQREHRAELLEFAERLESAGVPPEGKAPINLQRVPRDRKAELEAIREQDLKDLARQTLDRSVAPLRALIFDALERFEALYLERKQTRGALDFNDLERRAIELLSRNEAVRSDIRKQFRQIMLDEFQDVNEQQNELVRLIRGEDVFFAVGDANQSIYGFRHARPAIFAAYRNEVETSGRHSGSLMTNFRSRAEILKCVEALLNSATGIEPRALVAGRTFSGKPGPSIEVIRCLDRDEDEEDEDEHRESKWIAHRVLALREERGFDFRSFAVLCRSRDAMNPILREFDRAGIPYVCGRRQSFLASREGQDIQALLQVLVNTQDTVALATVLRSPLVGLSDEALLRARLKGHLLAEAEGFAEEDAGKLDRFRANLKRWRADTAPLDVRIARMLGDCAYPFGENVEAFLQLARTRSHGRTLTEFLRELEGIEMGLNSESDLSDEDQGNCVQVMTAHAAKGLEFRVTIVAALHQGTRKGIASVSFTPEHGLGVKWRDPGNSYKGHEDSWARANGKEVKRREDDEANRLFYVAMTRAEEHLILSYTVSEKRKPQNWAALVDAFFATPRTAERDGFEASVLMTDADPPQLTNVSGAQAAAAEAEVIPRPAAGAADETVVNVTSVAAFRACPRKYFLQRYLGWSPVARRALSAREEHDDKGRSAADLGTEVHAVLAGEPGARSDEASALAEVFRRGELGRRAAVAPRAAREWEFIVEIEGFIVRGTIDLWFEQDGEREIVDYKTDAKIHTEEYAPQLALYAIALEKAFGKSPARAWLHFLRQDAIREVSIDEEARREARALVRRLRIAQENLTFELNEGPHCFTCPFRRGLCPAGM